MSQYHASIYSNLVAIALTLAGPRLWILLKALFFFAIDIYKRRSNRRNRLPIHVELALTSRPPPVLASPQDCHILQNETARSTPFEHDSLDATEISHSELGAAIMLIGNIWKLLKSARIELSSGSTYGKKNLSRFRAASTIWKNFLQRPIDVLVSLLLSVFFVAIFVAESTANVLSANIISDTTAIVSSPKCNLRYLSHPDSNAADYRRKCYRAKLGADGCDFFYNQSIMYSEKSENKCPFPGKTCALEQNPALTLDTGLLDSGLIGINSKKRYLFRRTATCAPLQADGEFINVTKIERWVLNKTQKESKYEFYGRQEAVSDNRGAIWDGEPSVTIGLNQYVFILSFYEIQLSSNSYLRLVCNPAKTMPKLVDSKVFPKDLVNSSSISIFLLGSQGMIYDKYREDPVFPATSKAAGGDDSHNAYVNIEPIPGGAGGNDDFRNAYVNNEPLPGILGCIDNTYICDSDLGTCWNYPSKPLTADGINWYNPGVWFGNPYKTENSWNEVEPFGIPQRLDMYEFPSLNASSSEETAFMRIWGRAIGSSATEADLALVFLSHVLWGSTLCYMWQKWRTIEAMTLCSNSIICENLPLDQWKAEVRQLFETSLAQLQYAVLDTVRGRNESWIKNYENIPPRFRGLCKMGKFKSVGWRNVSVWGLFGLLSFAAGVSLASVKTEEEELWLVIGFRLVGRALRCVIVKLRQLPWTYVWTRVFDFSILVQCHAHRVMAWAFSK